MFAAACSESLDVKERGVPKASKEAKSQKLRQNTSKRKDYKANADHPLAANANFDQSYTGNIANMPEAPQKNLIEDRSLIWNANLEFEVATLNTSFEKIRSLCKKHEGFISNMEQTNEAHETSIFLNIRVASEHFHDLVSAIKGQSKQLDLAVITSEDVTEEYLDLENRLETKRKARERYIEILRSKTGTIDEVIQAEEAIRRITEEIEAKEGRLRYLSDQVDFSTIELRMYKVIEGTKPVVAETPSYGDKAASSFESGWKAIKFFGLFLITIWPLLLIGGLLIAWRRKWFGEKLRNLRLKKS